MTDEYAKELKSRVKSCTRCALHKVYSGPIPISIGKPGWLCIGEAPGAEEDKNGVPFSGSSGRFLRQSLKSIGIPPTYTSFANAVSCRPHDNRDPSPYERQRCKGNLLAQINVAQPKVIITVGKYATNALYPHCGVDSKSPFVDRGRILYWGVINKTSVWIVPTWHPAYIIRPGGRKDERAWLDDLRLAKRLAVQSPSPDDLPDACRIRTCKEPVEVYDEMAGAWCKYHHQPVPREIWQDEMPGMGGLYLAESKTGKKVSAQKARARDMGLI